jgi:hypothetical protein
MALKQRLCQLELKLKLNLKQPGCNPTLFIIIPEDSQDMLFDSKSYRPTDDEIEKCLKHIKDSGQCRDCKGSCVIDWKPVEFNNYFLTGERCSSSSEPKISWMFCINAEIPILAKRIMNGERNG